jgi:hypothetical protein
MNAIRPEMQVIASYCPPLGKPLAYGRVFVYRVPDVGLKLLFQSDDKDVDDSPLVNIWLQWISPAKGKMGGRLDLVNDYYLIIGGGKKVAQQLAEILNQG